MPSISLTNYTIRIREKYKSKYLPLDHFLEDKDFLVEMDHYLGDRKVMLTHYPDRKILIRVTRCEGSNRSISGLIEIGEYGYRTDILNVESENLSYVRLNDDAEMLPFYFHLQVPHDLNVGVLVLQKIGPTGIKEIFEADLKNYFEEIFPGFELELLPLIPSQLVEHYMKHGRITRIRLVNFTTPGDIADRFAKGHSEEEGTVELHLTARRGGELPYLDRVREVLSGRRDVNKFLEVKDSEYENVKVEITVGESRRTLNLLHPEKIRGNFDVTPDLEYGEDGHPIFKSIDAVGREMVEDAILNLARWEKYVQ